MWNFLNNNINNDVYLTINKTPTKCKINDCNTTDDGCKWVTFSVYENKELTPSFFGSNLGSFNSLYSPKNKRTYKGWFSDEVFENLKFVPKNK